MSDKTMLRDLLNVPELQGAMTALRTGMIVEQVRKRYDLNDEVLVMLRKDDQDDLFALFPAERGNALGTLCDCYCVVGGHTVADYDKCIEFSDPAKGKDAKTIMDALKQVGYENLRVIKRASYRMHKYRMRALNQEWAEC
jgi:hypothetical protein